MRTTPETRARSSQEAGKRALNLWGSKANQACKRFVKDMETRAYHARGQVEIDAKPLTAIAANA